MFIHDEPRAVAALSAQNSLQLLLHAWSRASIQTKILVSLLLLMIFSLVGSTWGFVVSTSATRDRILDQQLDEDAGRMISALVYSERDALESASLLAGVLYTPLVIERAYPEKNQTEPMVNLVQPVYNRFTLDQVIVLNTDGQMRVNIAPSRLESIGVVGRDLLPPCSRPKSYLAQYRSEQLLIVCAPVLPSDSSDVPSITMGYVYTILDLSELLGRIRRDLELVATPQIIDRVQMNNRQAMDARHSKTGVILADGSGNFHASIVPVELADGEINISLMVDAQAINAIVGSGLRVMLLSNAIAIALSMLAVALAIQSMLTRPLFRLTAVAEQVAAGDLLARARVESFDEIGKLAHTFNATTAQLQELVTELEQRVEQRTAELTAANEFLHQEIAERKRAEEQIRHQKHELERLATTDELTGLYNRRHFFILAELEILTAHSSSHVLSAGMLDIDHFKKINDTYGHACGDQVLRIVAKRCRDNLRDTDIVGRYGGEEFVILLPRTDPETALIIAERLRADTAREPVQTERGPISITVSIGIACDMHENLNLTRLLEHADDALYAAKRQGRNRVVLSRQTLLPP